MKPLDLEGRRATVMGGARSGMAAALFLTWSGAQVFLSELRELPPDNERSLRAAGVEFETGGHSARCLDADVLVLSPGVPDTVEVVSEALRRGLPTVSETELASRYCEAPIVAVTGTNGKTTVTSLIGDMFRRTGRRTLVAGNIGRPLSASLREIKESDVVVLEVSSFQLDHTTTFRPAVSVLLNVTPDHLDRYGGDVERYAESKYRVFANQRDNDVFVYNLDDARIRERAAACTELKTAAFSCTTVPDRGAWLQGESIAIRFNGEEETLLDAKELALPGRHNVYNSLAAAVAARALAARNDVIRESLRGFQGVEHRLEFVRELSGVRWINDSKATNVHALRCALESFDNAVVLIVGGRDKGNDWRSIRQAVRTKVHAIISFGECADTVLRQIGGLATKAARVATLEEASRVAQSMARPGDVVLLSPACASFDQFTDYEHRGRAFKQIVQRLRGA